MFMLDELAKLIGYILLTLVNLIVPGGIMYYLYNTYFERLEDIDYPDWVSIPIILLVWLIYSLLVLSVYYVLSRLSWLVGKHPIL